MIGFTLALIVLMIYGTGAWICHFRPNREQKMFERGDWLYK